MARLFRSLLVAWVLASVLPISTMQAATSLQVCRDWEGQGVGCAGRFPQGAPWITVVVQDIPKGRLALLVTGPDGPGTPLVIARDGQGRWWVTTGIRFTPRPAGAYTVTLTDQATGFVAAQAAYTVAAQTPREAVAIWRDLRQPFAVLGLALAEWRLGEETKARELAQSLLTSNRFVPDVYSARLLFYAMAMNDRDYPQAVDAAQGLIDAKRASAGQTVQPIEYVNLVNALGGACRIDQARAALVEGLREYPNVPALTTLAGDIDKAREKCP